jgi:transcriptional regulator with XRE-family HTH domain
MTTTSRKLVKPVAGTKTSSAADELGADDRPKDASPDLAFSTEKLGAAIRKVRERKQISRKDLASNAGISENYLAIIEGSSKPTSPHSGKSKSDTEKKERNVSVDVLNRIAAALGIRATWLLVLAASDSSREGVKSRGVSGKIDSLIIEVNKMIDLWISADATQTMSLLDSQFDEK